MCGRVDTISVADILGPITRRMTSVIGPFSTQPEGSGSGKVTELSVVLFFGNLVGEP